MRTSTVTLLVATMLHASMWADERYDRVRTPRREAALLLDRAREESRTVRELLDALSTTDVIVYVEIARHPLMPRAGTTLLSAAGGVRYLLITVNPDHDLAARIAYLGHELQHALEIARAPHVTDQVSLRRLFQRIGTNPGASDNFETEMAEVIGRRVWFEVSGAVARRSSADQSARPMRSWSFSR